MIKDMGTIWNNLIHVRDKAKRMLKDEPLNESLKDIEKRSEMYLRQLNTASGLRVRNEAEGWLIEIHHFIKD